MGFRKVIAPKMTLVVAGAGVSMLLACSDSEAAGEHAEEHSGSTSSPKAQSAAASNTDEAGSSGKSGAAAGNKTAASSAGQKAEAGAGGVGGRAGSSGRGGGAAGASGGGGKAAGSSGAAAGGGGSAAGSSGAASGNGGNAAGGGGSAAGSGGSNAGSDVAVTIRFKAKVGSQDFACGQEYDGQGSANTRVAPQDFRMFIQDLSLIRADDTLVPVQLDVRAPWQSEGVALLDFENGSASCVEGTPETNTQITGRIAEGDYKGVAFSNGVPEELNHKDPATLTDPLKTYANLSWGWLTGFRFSKLELVQVVPPGEVFGVGLAHSGATACTGNPMQNTVSCAKPNRNKIELQPFDASSDTVLVDIGAVFKDTNLTETAECHGTGSYCTSMFSALGINFADGKAKDGQTVFKVE